MKTKKQNKILYLLFILFSIAVIASCGKGSENNSSNGNSGGDGNNTQKAWGQPTLIENAASPAGGPAVAADRLNNSSNDGSVIAVWSQDNSIYASRYTGSWSSRALIGNNIVNIGESAYSPRIAMGDNGQALVVWGYTDGSNRYYIWSSHYDGDYYNWSTAELISGLGAGNANSPQLAFDGSGNNVFTLWSQYQYGSTRYNYRATQRQYYYAPCPPPYACGIDPNDFYWRSTSVLSHN